MSQGEDGDPDAREAFSPAQPESGSGVHTPKSGSWDGCASGDDEWLDPHTVVGECFITSMGGELIAKFDIDLMTSVGHAIMQVRKAKQYWKKFAIIHRERVLTNPWVLLSDLTSDCDPACDLNFVLRLQAVSGDSEDEWREGMRAGEPKDTRSVHHRYVRR